MDQQPPNTDPAQHAAAEIMRRLRAKERELRETQATLEQERVPTAVARAPWRITARRRS